MSFAASPTSTTDVGSHQDVTFVNSDQSICAFLRFEVAGTLPVNRTLNHDQVSFVLYTDNDGCRGFDKREWEATSFTIRTSALVTEATTEVNVFLHAELAAGPDDLPATVGQFTVDACGTVSLSH